MRRRPRPAARAFRHGQDGNIKRLRWLTVAATRPCPMWGKRGWADGTYPLLGFPQRRTQRPLLNRTGTRSPSGYAWAPTVGLGTVRLQVDGGPRIDADLGSDLGL